jgi:hypothetical protein
MKQLTIHFIDGSKVSFDFPTQTDPHHVSQYVDNLLKNQYLAIEADGSVHLYPLNNIKSIQVTPVPEQLPGNVIKNATISPTY